MSERRFANLQELHPDHMYALMNNFPTKNCWAPISVNEVGDCLSPINTTFFSH